MIDNDDNMFSSMINFKKIKGNLEKRECCHYCEEYKRWVLGWGWCGKHKEAVMWCSRCNDLYKEDKK